MILGTKEKNKMEIKDNLRVYIRGEKDAWMKHYGFDKPETFLEVFGFDYNQNFYPDDCPCYTIRKEDDHFEIYYSFDGCTEYNSELEDDDGCCIHFTKEQVFDFFSKMDVEYFE